jgi:hypothetical protein
VSSFGSRLGAAGSRAQLDIFIQRCKVIDVKSSTLNTADSDRRDPAGGRRGPGGGQPGTGRHGPGGDGRALAKAALPVLVGLALVIAFTAVFVSGFHDPRPNGVEVGVVGSTAETTAVRSALAHQAPGGFDVRSYTTEAAARAGLLDADVHGVLLAGPRSDRVLVAGSYGSAPSQAIAEALQGAAAARGRPATVRDVESLPAHDSRGLSSLFTVFGTVMPSLLFGGLLAILGRPLPAVSRWAALLIYSALAGLAVAFSVDTLVGALTGHFWGIAGVISLLALAVASLSYGLGQLLGPPGVAGAVLIAVLLGQSTSGGAITYEFQPGFHHALSQLLPNGAALTALRNTVYFGGSQTTTALLVLLAWAAGGLGLDLLAQLRRRRPLLTRTVDRAPADAPV